MPPCQIVVCCFFLSVLCLPTCLNVCLLLDLTTVLTFCHSLDYNPNANPAILTLSGFCSCFCQQQQFVFLHFLLRNRGRYLLLFELKPCSALNTSLELYSAFGFRFHAHTWHLCMLPTYQPRPNLTPSLILHETHVGHWHWAIIETVDIPIQGPFLCYLCLTLINKMSIRKQQIRINWFIFIIKSMCLTFNSDEVIVLNPGCISTLSFIKKQIVSVPLR